MQFFRGLVGGEGGGFGGGEGVVGVEAEVGEGECCAGEGAGAVDLAFAADV